MELGELAAALVAGKHYARAEPRALELHARCQAVSGDGHERTTAAVQGLVDLYAAWGRPEDAKVWRDRLPGK